jgi:hypothetical protein
VGRNQLEEWLFVGSGGGESGSGKVWWCVENRAGPMDGRDRG